MIYYDILLYTIIYYYILLYIIIYYYLLLHIIIYYYILLYVIISYYILSYIIVYYYILLYIITISIIVIIVVIIIIIMTYYDLLLFSYHTRNNYLWVKPRLTTCLFDGHWTPLKGEEFREIMGHPFVWCEKKWKFGLLLSQTTTSFQTNNQSPVECWVVAREDFVAQHFDVGRRRIFL